MKMPEGGNYPDMESPSEKFWGQPKKTKEPREPREPTVFGLPLKIGGTLGLLVIAGGTVKALHGGGWPDLFSALVAGLVLIIIGSLWNAGSK
jgi:hypothetical protein